MSSDHKGITGEGGSSSVGSSKFQELLRKRAENRANAKAPDGDTGKQQSKTLTSSVVSKMKRWARRDEDEEEAANVITPSVHFIGTIEMADVFVGSSIDNVFVSYHILCEEDLKGIKGKPYGETRACVLGNINELKAPFQAGFVFNEPIDCAFQAASGDKWPLIFCEVWVRHPRNPRSRVLLGHGVRWMPNEAGFHSIDVGVWQPIGEQVSSPEHYFQTLNLQALRVLTLQAHDTLKTRRVGNVVLKVHVLTRGR